MIELLDLGCGNGGSIKHFQNMFNAQSHLGIDNDINDIIEAKKSGYDVALGDITKTDYPQSNIVTSYHVLEHLHTLKDVETVIKKASKSATDFIYCVFPNFDDDKELESLGLKFTWSDWLGHPTKLTTVMIKSIVDKLGLIAYYGKLTPVQDSFHNEIIPFSSPVDTIYYSSELGEKQYIEFKGLYKETAVLITLRELENIDELLQKTGTK